MVTFHDLLDALSEIEKIVHRPTSKTSHRSADDHYQADFDAIRRICADTLKKARG